MSDYRRDSICSEQQTYPEAHSQVILIATLARVHLYRGPDADWGHWNVRHDEVLWPVSNVQQDTILCSNGREQGQDPHGVQVVSNL